MTLALAATGCSRAGSGEHAQAPADTAVDAKSPGTSAQMAPEIVPVTNAGLHEAIAASPARVVMLNVWATWCDPCREEFPDLVRFYRTYRDRGLQLMLVSADFDEQRDDARAFLAGQHVDFPTWIKTGDDMEFINSLNPKWTGALPATFVYSEGGHLKAFWQGKATYEEMERRVLPVLQSRSP